MSDYGVGALGGVVLIDPDTGLPYKAEGGGGGGAVESVNGKTGAVDLTLQDVIDGDVILEENLYLTYDANNPDRVASINPTFFMVQWVSGGKSATLTPDSVLIATSPSSGARIYADESSEVVSELILPSESGTLARIEDLAPEPPASGTYTLQSVDGVVSWVEA